MVDWMSIEEITKDGGKLLAIAYVAGHSDEFFL